MAKAGAVVKALVAAWWQRWAPAAHCATQDADFCYSPMGQNGGDTDRYVAAIMFGCIPVMLNSSHWRIAVPHALPLEEVLHWER